CSERTPRVSRAAAARRDSSAAVLALLAFFSLFFCCSLPARSTAFSASVAALVVSLSPLTSTAEASSFAVRVTPNLKLPAMFLLPFFAFVTAGFERLVGRCCGVLFTWLVAVQLTEGGKIAVQFRTAHSHYSVFGDTTSPEGEDGKAESGEPGFPPFRFAFSL